jgi:hypothetical protein
VTSSALQLQPQRYKQSSIRGQNPPKNAVRFHFSLTSFITTHPSSCFILEWTPLDYSLEQQMRAFALAKETCQLDPPGGLDQCQARSPPASHTANILTCPTGRQQPPSLASGHGQEKDDREQKVKKFTYSRRTTSTALQMGVDHTFTGTYSSWFRPGVPLETWARPCDPTHHPAATAPFKSTAKRPLSMMSGTPRQFVPYSMVVFVRGLTVIQDHAVPSLGPSTVPEARHEFQHSSPP